MAKRKRDFPSTQAQERPSPVAKRVRDGGPDPHDDSLTLQLVAGSYDRVLHGITATMNNSSVQFADTFLFDAHSSAIRCLALSPPSTPVAGQDQKVMLATGSSDEKINIYNLSAHPARRKTEQVLLSSMAPRPIAESSKNRELGTLLHHSSTVTGLYFPTRSKLLSSSEDSTTAVVRTRDWSLLSTIKAPKPKIHGRPSGDTASLGGTPSGINDFAVHPSMKLMISVSKGERCMRLWNLVTGKKAGVLNFARGMLEDAGEGKHATGEGRRVAWGRCGDADEFAVGFDRNVVVFGMDSRPRCKVMADSRIKVHQFAYLSLNGETGEAALAVSTEDGRILFVSTRAEHLQHEKQPGTETVVLPAARVVSQLGGAAAGISGRIKDFVALPTTDKDARTGWIIVSGGSDGSIRVWRITADDIRWGEGGEAGRQVGTLQGTYETQNRITCLGAFIMIPRPEGAGGEDSEDETDEPDERSRGGSGTDGEEDGD